MSTSGITFNVSFDASIASAPAGFLPAFTQALQFFENAFKVLVTINLDVGWGEVHGTAIAPGALGENIPGETGPLSFTEVQTALMANAAASGDSSLVNALRTTDPTNGGQFVMSNAEAKVLGLRDPNAASTDGWIGFSGNRNYTFDPSNRTVPGSYDFLGIAEHEISEVLGRYLFAGAGGQYTPLDLLRYSAPGVHDVTPGSGSYLSLDNGKTSVNGFNGAPGFDPGDWAGSTIDAFNAFMTPGHEYDVSAGDIAELNALGYGSASSAGTLKVSGVVVGVPGQIIAAGAAATQINATAGNQSVVLGSGAATVFGGVGDTIIGGAGPAYIDGSAGGMWIITGTAGGSDTIMSGASDTISGVGADVNIMGAAGDIISTGAGTAIVNAMAGNELVTLGSGAATVFGGAGGNDHRRHRIGVYRRHRRPYGDHRRRSGRRVDLQRPGRRDQGRVG